MWTVLKTFFGAVTGVASASAEKSVIGRALDLAGEKLVDVDKLLGLLAGVIQRQQELEAQMPWIPALQALSKETPPTVRAAVATYIWGDAIHKLARTLLWIAVLVVYVVVTLKTGQRMSFEDLMMLSAGPGIYTLLKGAGRTR